MKITTSQLKQIIKEEIKSLLEAEEEWPPPSLDDLNRMAREEMERRGRLKDAIEAGCMNLFLDKIKEDIEIAEEQARNGEPPDETTQGLRAVLPWLVEKHPSAASRIYGAQYIDPRSKTSLFGQLKKAIQIGSEISIEGQEGFFGVSNVAQRWKEIGERAIPPVSQLGSWRESQY